MKEHIINISIDISLAKERRILDIEGLRYKAREIAKHYSEVERGRSNQSKFPDIQKCNNTLIQSYKRIDQDIRSKVSMTPAAEWFMDNFYVIEEHMKGIQYNLSREYFRGLPVFAMGRLKGFPRSYVIAREIVKSSGTSLDEDSIYEFLYEYQEE